ncbi:MAG: efflux RND transporter periplasmic adaptor subunit [Myxococcales bacterium]|nr:efflux RND transporter periplasmic adaptor subunit [Myxococcales bacterium]
MSNRRSKYTIGLVVASSLWAACGKGGKGGEATQAKAAAEPLLQIAAEDVVTVTQGEIQTGPRISGTLEASQRAVIRAESNGAVVRVGPELGQVVKRGEMLARIESKALGDGVQSAQAAVQSAQAMAAMAQREVERTKAMVEGGALAQRDLERAESAAKSASAGLGQARAMLAASRSQFGDATVLSPMAGVVSQRPVNQGDVVSMGALLYEIIEPSSMRLLAQVSSDGIASLGIGKVVTFEVRGYEGQKFEGTILRIAPAADPNTRQLPIIIEIPNTSGKLVAGLFAEGRVSSEVRKALVVPGSAIDTSGDQPTVLRVNQGVAERVVVATGLRDARNEVVEITSGVAAGDVLITARAGQKIKAGTKVTLPGAAAATTTPPSSQIPTPAASAAAAPSTTGGN